MFLPGSRLSAPACIPLVVFTFTGLTVGTSVDPVLPVCQLENMIQAVLHRSNTSWILAANDIDDLLRKSQVFLLHDLAVFYVADSDVGVNLTQDIQVQIHGVGNL